MARYIPCKKHLLISALLNAAIARPQFSSRRKLSSTKIRIPPAIKSAKRSPAISAAAPLTCKSSKPWKPLFSKSLAKPKQAVSLARKEIRSAYAATKESSAGTAQRNRRRSPRNRPPPSPCGRSRQSHRPNPLRRRHFPPPHGPLQTSPLPASARAHPQHRRLACPRPSRCLSRTHGQRSTHRIRHSPSQPG